MCNFLLFFVKFFAHLKKIRDNIGFCSLNVIQLKQMQTTNGKPSESKIQFRWISRQEDKKEFMSVTRKIKNRFDTMCKHMIQRSYFTKTMLPHADMIVVAEKHQKWERIGRRQQQRDVVDTVSSSPRMEMQGFMLIQQKGKDILFIDLLCSRGVGRALLDNVVEFAKENKINFITLHALPYVINYYRNFGFRVNRNPRSCSDDKRFTELYNSSMEKKKFATIDESLEDKAFVSVIQQLMKLKINVKDGKDFEEKLTHGFPMVLCIRSKRKQ